MYLQKDSADCKSVQREKKSCGFLNGALGSFLTLGGFYEHYAKVNRKSSELLCSLPHRGRVGGGNRR